MKKLAIVALTGLLWMGCGDDDATENNTSANNTSANNTSTNNTSTNNTSTNNTSTNNTSTNNTSTNNTSTNNTSTNNTNLPDEPYITSFEWITRGSDCTFANCDSGFILSTPARTISNFDGRLATINNETDWQAWEEAALNLNVIQKMRNGWDCPEPAEDGQTKYRIRARIQDNGPMLHEQPITGCIEDSDAELLAIQEVIEDLERTYLP